MDFVYGGDYLFPSYSLNKIPIDIKAMNNEIINKFMTQVKPGQIIQIGPLTFYYLVKQTTPPEVWLQVSSLIQNSSSEACRWSIRRDYLSENIAAADILIVGTNKDAGFEKVIKTQGISALGIGSYDADGHIILICAKQFESDDLEEQTGNRNIKISLGLFTICWMLTLFTNLGIQNVYLDASTVELIDYYSKLGFLLGKETCGMADPITDIHLNWLMQTPISERKNKLVELQMQIPSDYITSAGYRMKFCGIQNRDIWNISLDNIRDNLPMLDAYPDALIFS